MTRISRRGFTILELALAMAFISFLLLSIGLATANFVSIYQKGLVMKQINEEGRELVDELSRGIEASVYLPLEDGEDFGTYYFERSENLRAENGIDSEVPLYGVFCTGLYTYLWNTGYSLTLDEADLTNTARVATWQSGAGDVSMSGFRLLRISDSSRKICQNQIDNPGHEFVGGSNAVEMLPVADGGLVLFDLKTFEPSYDKTSKHALYSLSFILGTLGRGVDITASGDFCKTGYSGIVTDFTFCAVNKFNFAARAMGGISHD